MTLRICGITALALLGAAAGASVPQTMERTQLMPLDQAGQDRSFVQFRERFITAVKAREARVVIDASVPELQEGFRGSLDLPPSAFAGPNREASSWEALEELLAVGGGSFTTTRGAVRGRREFCAPYTFSTYPMPYPDLVGHEEDNEGHPWIILGASVPMLDRPSAHGKALTFLAYDLVTEFEQAPNEGPWYHVVAPDGQRGWVAASEIRDPADYHACFAQIGGVWKMTILDRGLPSWR